MVIYQPTTFGGQTHSAGEDMFLICYVILIQTRLEEKREEEHIQLQSFMHFKYHDFLKYRSNFYSGGIYCM